MLGQQIGQNKVKTKNKIPKVNTSIFYKNATGVLKNLIFYHI